MVERARLIAAYLEVVRGHVGARGPSVGPGTSVIDSGLVDSFALADVIAGIEGAVGVRLPVERLSPGDFDTAEILADRLTRLGVVGEA